MNHLDLKPQLRDHLADANKQREMSRIVESEGLISVDLPAVRLDERLGLLASTEPSKALRLHCGDSQRRQSLGELPYLNRPERDRLKCIYGKPARVPFEARCGDTCKSTDASANRRLKLILV